MVRARSLGLLALAVLTILSIVGCGSPAYTENEKLNYLDAATSASKKAREYAKYDAADAWQDDRFYFSLREESDKLAESFKKTYQGTPLDKEFELVAPVDSLIGPEGLAVKYADFSRKESSSGTFQAKWGAMRAEVEAKASDLDAKIELGRKK